MTSEEVVVFLTRVAREHGPEIERFLEEEHMAGMTFADRMNEEETNLFKAGCYVHHELLGKEGQVRAVKGTALSLKDTEGPPRRVPLRRLSGPLRDFVRKEIARMLRDGIIRPSRSPWAAAVCLTPKTKKDGTKTWRFAIDYRLLNKATPMDSYVIPPVEEGLDCLRGKSYFSVVDMMSAYWSIPIADDGSIAKTAFICHEAVRVAAKPFRAQELRCHIRPPHPHFVWRAGVQELADLQRRLLCVFR
jgi:hypothetical protein